MQHYSDNVQDLQGNARTGVPVSIYSGAVLATIYADNGSTVKANPMTSGAGGAFDFYAANGDYTISVSGSTKSITLFDAAAAPTATPTSADYVTGVTAAGAVRRFLFAFLSAATGAVARTFNDKLSDTIHANDFAGSDTVKLKAAFDHCIANAKVLELEGDYTVTGPICTLLSVAAGSLHIRCEGNVSITVDSGATAFTNLIYCESTAANNASITGGSLKIDLANKCATGLYIRHNAVSQSGSVHFECPVTVLNAKNTDAASTAENYGILVYGDYSKVVLNNPRVVGVDRTNTTGGACKGIGVAAFTGEVVINQPHVENVLCTGGTADADGIAVFAKAGASTYYRREGRAIINDPVFIDCQGRSFKSQCSDTTVYRPRVKRQNVVSIAQGVDFDFQLGNGLLVEPDYEYKLSGATSPLGASFSCVAFQQTLDDAPMHAKSIGGTLRTEAAIPIYALVVHQATALASETEVSGLRVIPLGAFATAAFSRAVLEFNASTVEAKSTKTRLIVRDVSGPMDSYAIGHTGYGGGALTSKLSFEVSNFRNTLPVASTSRPFNAVSGSAITAVEAFLVRNNHGLRDILGITTFSFATLQVGCTFTTEIATASATNPPGWGATGYAHIECIGCYLGDTDRAVRVTVNNASAANTVFFTQDGGTTWGTIL